MRCLFFVICLSSFMLAHAQNLQFAERQLINRKSAEVGVGDFNRDGHMDIAICNSEQRWYAGPTFSTFYKIGDSEGGPYAARVSDINGDGWDDFITSDGTRTQQDVDNRDGELYVYINPGGSGGDPKGLWNRIVVYSGNVRHQNDMRIADMDGDGRLDIIERTWSSERVVVAMQNEDINSWTTRVFDTGETGQPEGISAGDVDGDGDMEIVLSGVYWDNPGGWRTGDPISHVIDVEFIQEEVKSAVGDIDGDGDNDIYMGSAERTYRFLAWYENLGTDVNTGGVNFEKHLIEDDIGNCHMVELIDIDADGDLDLCTSQSFSDSGCLIYYNNDWGSSWTKQDYDPDGKLYTGVVRDLDGDGDFDIVGPSGFYSNVYFYENLTPGDPPEAPSHLTATLINGQEINLQWQDNANNEGTYVIERWEDGTWSSLSTVLADVTSYTDGMTIPASSYQYRLFASNFVGNSDTITSNLVDTWPSAGKVMISPPGGNYVNSRIISIRAIAPYEEIRYTIDGSEPDATSMLYTEPFMISSSTIIKARSMGMNLIDSELTVEEYNIAINGNFPPTADAGLDQNYNMLANVVLNGSTSTDLDDQDDLLYQWIQYDGPDVIIQNEDSSIAQFIPDTAGMYRFELRVSDEILTDLDSVTIIINDISEDLIAYWPLDESEGNALELVNGNDAIVTSGITYLPGGGQVNGAMALDGAPLTRALAPSINIPGEEMTITCWMKADNLASVEGRIISKASGANANDHLWMLSLNGGSALRFRLKTDESNQTTTLISNEGEVDPGQWYFVAVWYDGTTMKIYKDLSEIISTAKTGTIVNADILVALGNQPTPEASRPFPGTLDDIRIYNKALTTQEMRAIYEQACPNVVIINNQIYSNDSELNAGQTLELKNISITEASNIVIRSVVTNIEEPFNIEEQATLQVLQESGCNR